MDERCSIIFVAAEGAKSANGREAWLAVVGDACASKKQFIKHQYYEHSF